MKMMKFLMRYLSDQWVSKAAKMATLAAKGKFKGSSSVDDGNSKESSIDLDKLDRLGNCAHLLLQTKVV